MTVLFWICLAACVYVYFGYPALLWIVSRLRPRPAASADITPAVTFIIPAYNEESVIGEKIENTLALDYPSQQIEVLIVSNGSTDRTNEIVRSCKDPRVHLLALSRPGKMQALNEGAAAARGEILVFTDADFLLDAHSLLRLTSHFADPRVGGVCGSRNTRVRREGDATGEGEGLYARWDKWQKTLESKIGSVFAADGLLYAIRRALYVPITDIHAADDIAISTRIPLQGYRLLFDPEATAYERADVHAEQELARRIRVTNHSVRAILGLGRHLFTHGFYSLELVSHKLVRHLVPFFLIPLFITSAFLYRVAFAGQVLIYALAIAGWLLRNSRIGRAKPLFVPYYFCFVNAAALFGVLSLAHGRRVEAWSSRAQPRDGTL